MHKFKAIKYIDRKTGEEKIEKVMGENFLKFLYYNPFAKLPLNLLVRRKLLTDIYGKRMDKASSCRKIKSFVEDMAIDMSESKKSIKEFTSFNDFFIRELKAGSRKIDEDKSSLISPADGKILAYTSLNEKDKFFVKGNEFNLQEFFMDKTLAKKYEGGTFVIVRLAPADYHRFHFPAKGLVSKTKLINGYYYSVSTHAIKTNFRIFCENKREYSLLKTENFGDVAMFEIGATMVGGITQTYKANTIVNKGDEKGYFYFGGSTCILLFEKDKILIDSDILENTRNGIETKVYMGEKIAYEKKN